MASRLFYIFFQLSLAIPIIVFQSKNNYTQTSLFTARIEDEILKTTEIREQTWAGNRENNPELLNKLVVK